MRIAGRLSPAAFLLASFAAASPLLAGPAQQTAPTRDRLASPVVVDGVPCDAGYLWRFPSGQLHRCTIDRDARVRGAQLPKGSTVAFKEDGDYEYVFLPRTSEIEGYQCRGSGHDFMTTFHPNGRLKLCWFPQDREVQGVPCAAFSFWSDAVLRKPSGVSFHPNGALAECRLSGDATIKGTAFRRGTRVRLDAEGHPLPGQAPGPGAR